MKQPKQEREGQIDIIREYILRFEQTQKPLRNQVIIEGATQQALRTTEISTLRVEWFNFETGDYQLLDSKKHVMFTRPMATQWAKHVDELIGKRTEGTLIQPFPDAPHTGRKEGSKTKGSLEGLCIQTIDRIFAECSTLADVPTQTPRMCRAFRACEEHYILRKPTIYIQWLLRHDDLQSTEHYLRRHTFYHDQKAMFYQGKEQPFFQSECARSGVSLTNQGCPNAAPSCRCRWFTPRMFPMAITKENQA